MLCIKIKSKPFGGAGVDSKFPQMKALYIIPSCVQTLGFWIYLLAESSTLLATMYCIYIGLTAITSTVSLHLGTSSLFPAGSVAQAQPESQGLKRKEPAETSAC